MTSGYIQVKNTGGFIARFDVQYMSEGREITVGSGKFTAGTSSSIVIPHDATNISLKIKVKVFIGSWSTVITKIFEQPIKMCFEVYGTTLNAHVKEVTCE